MRKLYLILNLIYFFKKSIFEYYKLYPKIFIFIFPFYSLHFRSKNQNVLNCL